MTDKETSGKPTGPTDNSKQTQAKPELVSSEQPKTGEQGARTSPPDTEPPAPKSQAEMRGEAPKPAEPGDGSLNSAKELERKSVAMAGPSEQPEETELSRSRSRTQNPAGGHTPEQLHQERKGF